MKKGYEGIVVASVIALVSFALVLGIRLIID